MCEFVACCNIPLNACRISVLLKVEKKKVLWKETRKDQLKGEKKALSLESTEQIRANSRFLCTTDLNSITFSGAGPVFFFFFF